MIIPLTFTPSDTNYAAKNVTLTVNINEKDTPSVTADPLTVTYTGSPVSDSAITGSASFSGNPVPGSFVWKGSPSITNVADSGSKTVSFIPADAANYYSVDADVVLTINKANCTGAPSYTAVSAPGKTLADAQIITGTLAPAYGSVSWDEPLSAPVVQGKSYGWTYTPADSDNYNNLTGSAVLWAESAASGGRSTPSNPAGGSVAPANPAGSGSSAQANAANAGDSGSALPFTDVASGDYFYEPVKWAFEKGITAGTDENTFSPALSCTRAQMAAMLYRFAKSPSVSSASGFADVLSGIYYENAVNWALEKGITEGTGENTFSPNADCSRSQMVTFLYRYMGKQL